MELAEYKPGTKMTTKQVASVLGVSMEELMKEVGK